MKVCFTHANWCWTPEELIRQEKMAAIAIKSVRASMPHVEIVQMSDVDTPELKGVDSVSRFGDKSMFFAEWTTEHFSRVDGDAIFLDTDIVVQKDLGAVFKTGFDVLMCIREKSSVLLADGRKMPVNMGVVWSRCPAFWADMHERIKKMSDPRDKCWWGAQLAAYEIHLERKYRFFALPMDPYNYSPKEENEDVSDKWVVHYKGKRRKPWMLNRHGLGS